MILMSSNVQLSHTFKFLCKILNKGEKADVLKCIVDELLTDFISKALDEDPAKRATVDELLTH